MKRIDHIPMTIHRTPTGTIPSFVLGSKNKPKPTPEIGSTPSLNSRLSDNLILNVDVTRYYDGYEFYDRDLTEGKYYFSNGYVSFRTVGNVDPSQPFLGTHKLQQFCNAFLFESEIVRLYFCHKQNNQGYEKDFCIIVSCGNNYRFCFCFCSG